MADGSSIEWTDATWSPVVGCTRVSAGCDHCYAVRQTRRLAAMGQEKYRGLVNEGKGHFNGVARLHAPSLALPLRWRRGRRVFVNPMSDLFHEEIGFEEIAAVFGVMAAAPQHTFQVLTKRPERAREWFRWIETALPSVGRRVNAARGCMWFAWSEFDLRIPVSDPALWRWLLPNVWLGVSVEDQATADQRIPLLLQCPAAVRFVSYEPALASANFREWMVEEGAPGICFDIDGQWWHEPGSCRHCRLRLDWIIIGGESGRGARPFEVAWARETVRQCREAGVACFVKQFGSRPVCEAEMDHEEHPLGAVILRHRKGGDPDEWPEDLRVREFPRAFEAPQEPPA